MRSVSEHPLVSTVIPVFNRPLRLREAVASVLAQDWRSLEIIIVDDGSTDGGATWSVAEALIAENPGSVVGLRQANAGPGAARQRGVSAAQGEFLQFLDSDDVYHPQKTSRLMHALEKAPSAGIAYCDSVRRSSNGIVGPDTGHRGSETHHTIFPALLEGRLWNTNAVLYRRSVVEHAGGWPTLRQCEDLLFDATVGATGVMLTHVPEALVELRSHADSGEHLGHAWRRDPDRHRERCEALLGVLNEAQRVGVPPASNEMKRFVRTLFFEARLAAVAGLEPEAQRMLAAAERLAVEMGWQLSLFRIMACVIGWSRAGRLASAAFG